MSNQAIKTVNLSKIFNRGKNNELLAIEKVNLEIETNTCQVLVGPSGSGKSTLLSILSCLAKPTEGKYICLGEKVSHWSEKFLTDFRRKHVGIVFQNFQLVQGFSVFMNIATPLIPLKLSSKKIQAKVEKVAEMINIHHKLKQKVDTLSGGEMQRVAIARALVNEPTLIFADEPTAHLDREMSIQILAVLANLKKQNKTILITTHDTLVENHDIIDGKILMKDGNLSYE